MIIDLLQIDIPENKKIEVMEYLSNMYHSGETMGGSKIMLKPGPDETAEEIAKEIVEIKKKILDIL